MRNVLWTIFLVVALQNVAAGTTALASPTAEKATAADTRLTAESTTARLEAGTVKTASRLRADSERRSTQDRPEILSRNFATPKPVQIYWFFGGR